MIVLSQVVTVAIVSTPALCCSCSAMPRESRWVRALHRGSTASSPTPCAWSMAATCSEIGGDRLHSGALLQLQRHAEGVQVGAGAPPRLDREQPDAVRLEHGRHLLRDRWRSSPLRRFAAVAAPCRGSPGGCGRSTAARPRAARRRAPGAWPPPAPRSVAIVSTPALCCSCSAMPRESRWVRALHRGSTASSPTPCAWSMAATCSEIGGDRLHSGALLQLQRHAEGVQVGAGAPPRLDREQPDAVRLEHGRHLL